MVVVWNHEHMQSSIPKFRHEIIWTFYEIESHWNSHATDKCGLIEYMIFIKLPSSTRIRNKLDRDGSWSWRVPCHQMEVVWAVMPCRIVVLHRRFRGAYCLHRQRDGMTSWFQNPDKFNLIDTLSYMPKNWRTFCTCQVKLSGLYFHYLSVTTN